MASAPGATVDIRNELFGQYQQKVNTPLRTNVEFDAKIFFFLQYMVIFFLSRTF